MSNKKEFFFFTTGGCSILVLFVSITLASFAALSMISANNNVKLSNKLAQSTTAYYEADTRALVVLSEIDDVLKESFALPHEQYLDHVYSTLMSIDNINAQKEQDFLNLFFSVDISPSQSLEINLSVPQNDNADERYIIKYWKSVTKYNEIKEDPLDVWSGI